MPVNFVKEWVLYGIRRTLGVVRLEGVSRYRLAKAYYLMRLTWVQRLRSLVLIGLGVMAAAFGLESFLIPNGFIDGGVTGISLLMAKVSGLTLSVWLLLINAPFILLAWRQIGARFALRSVLAITGLALVVATVHFPILTQDKLLIATFGGFFLGMGIGLAVRGGAVLDGTEVLAIYLSRHTGLTVGDIILIFNILIFAVASWLLGIEVALYAILTYLAAARTIDFVIEGVEEYIGVMIVSSHHEEIRMMLVHKMQRGVTVYNGLRGHGSRHDLHETEIIYTVITRLEIARMQHEIDKIDPNAFVAMHSVKDIRGGIIKKRPLSH
ncbi:MAG: YitT family protein [Saprospiraceae bacterium]|nr:YitT family protein [Saprospiraceae bacterium]